MTKKVALVTAPIAALVLKLSVIREGVVKSYTYCPDELKDKMK